jgi:RND family efflux transporter MFP subunit
MALFTRKRIAPVAVMVAGLLIAYGVLFGKGKPEPRSPVPQRAPIVDVVVVDPQDIALSVSTQGTVRPHREINIVSQVAGRVEAISPYFAEGGFFDAENELVRVESSDYEFARVRAEARVADAVQLVAQEKGRVRQAAREWRDLGNEESNALFLRKPQLAGAEAALRAAEADLGEASLNLERTSIRVPFNGRISEKHVDVGQYITPGTVIARVYGTAVVEIRLPLTDKQVALLDLPLNFEDHSVIGDDSPVVLSARFADRRWQWHGEIVRTDASIDLDSRVVYAVVEVQRPFARDDKSDRPPLVVGLFVDAEISGRRLQQVATLPRTALRNDGTVLVVDGQDRIQPRSVRVLKSSVRQAWLQGLNAGDRVVVSSLPMAISGMLVTPKAIESVAVIHAS